LASNRLIIRSTGFKQVVGGPLLPREVNNNVVAG
jgi:hypothetical protein